MNPIKKEYVLNTWFSLVTESKIFDNHKSTYFNRDTEYEFQFISEKTMRPVKTFQPFVLFGNTGALQNLKELGFKTFVQYWSEEYDNIQDTQKRLEAIVDITKKLTKISTASWLQMYKDMQPILEHNYKILVDTEWLPTLDSIL